MMKAVSNAEYLAMIGRGISQLSSGKGQQHELVEVEEKDITVINNRDLEERL